MITKDQTKSKLEAQIAEALMKCAAPLTQTGRGHWSFDLANGKAVSATARLTDEWLLLEAPAARLSDEARPRDDLSEDLLATLKLNGEMEALSKLVLTQDTAIRLRAEIPLDGEMDARSRVVSAFAGLKAALRRCHGKASSGPPERQNDIGERVGGGSNASDSDCDAGALASDCGWDFNQRPGGKFVIDLDSRRGFYQAVVEARAEGVLVTAEMVNAESLSNTSREALAQLLLRASSIVRMARATLKEVENLVVAGFEVNLGASAQAAELGHALSSLSVACSLCGREAQLLRDDAIARRYLAMSGISKPIRSEWR